MLAIEYPLHRASIKHGEMHIRDHPLTESMVKLDNVKKIVPLVCERVGIDRWSRLVNKVTILPQRYVISRAYHKLHEIFMTCALPKPHISIHLCEAPGGFVQATSEFAAPGWTWKALSLYREGYPTPNTKKLPMHCGEFINGDIYDVDFCVNALPRSTACLVTLDGAFEMDHSRLEEEHINLLISESKVALSCLRKGGCLVAKFFEGAHLFTQQWIAWMSQAFTNVSIIKPNASRPSNSERYMVAVGYDPSQLMQTHPTECVVCNEWLDETRIVLDILASQQTKTLDRVIRQCG